MYKDLEIIEQLIHIKKTNELNLAAYGISHVSYIVKTNSNSIK